MPAAPAPTTATSARSAGVRSLAKRDYGTGVAAPLYFRHESSLRHDTGPHPEGPGRIPAIERELESRGWLGFERRDAPAVDPAALTAVHPQEFVDEIRRV